MAQHIGLQREDERGEVLAHYAPEGMPLEVLEFAPRHSACVRFIDPYGDTVFNQLQLPVLIGEFEQMAKNSPNAQLRGRLGSVVEFLAASQGIHQYVRFVGTDPKGGVQQLAQQAAAADERRAPIRALRGCFERRSRLSGSTLA